MVRRRAGTVIGGILLALLLTGCTPAAERGTLLPGSPTGASYDGPLLVPGPSGAAGRAVECATEVVGWQAPSPYDAKVFGDPVDALGHGGASGQRGTPTGYQVMRQEPDTMLVGRSHDGAIRQAVVLHRGRNFQGRRGWYVESWARCDWSELPPQAARAWGIGVWTDRAGARQDTAEINSWSGPAHCDWQSMTFLHLNGGGVAIETGDLRDPADGATYIAHLFPEYAEYGAMPAADDVAVPEGAIDTGYRSDGRTLWLATDRRAAYVGRDRDHAERWPLMIQDLACA